MIAITGIARSGKDTMGKSLAKIINKNYDKKAKVYSIADILKRDINPLCKQKFGFSSFTENTFDKDKIRPLMVSYGECMKEVHGKSIWVDKLLQKIDFEKYIPIITDLRFDYEADILMEKCNAFIIHVCKVGNEVPNDLEKINDPKVKAKAHIHWMWPSLGKNIRQAKDHTAIVWQMIEDEYKNSWRT